MNHPVELRLSHLLAAPQKCNQSRIQITGTGAHHQPRRRRKAHAGIHAFAIAHGGHAGTVAEMRENDAASRRRRIAEAREFFHQVGIG